MNKSGRKKFIHLRNAITFVVVTAILCTMCGGCIRQTEPITKAGYFFNTYITISFYSYEDAACFDDCLALCEKYEKLFSRTNPDSELYKLNHAGGKTFTVSEETAKVINDALSYCELTEGALDITVAPVLELWDFSDAADGKTPPSDEDIKNALSHVDYTKVRVDGCDITLEDPEAAIDLGFIAKGYIADRLKEMLKEKGVTSAIINLGGNVDLIGSKPNGGDYIIGVKRPFSENGETMTSVSIHDTSFVTSGIYERCFTYDNTLYHHILDAKTGYPVSNDLYQVSVLCSDSETADALSTTLMLMGKEKGMEYINSLDNIHAVFVDDSYTLTYSGDFPE